MTKKKSMTAREYLDSIPEFLAEMERLEARMEELKQPFDPKMAQLRIQRGMWESRCIVPYNITNPDTGEVHVAHKKMRGVRFENGVKVENDGPESDCPNAGGR